MSLINANTQLHFSTPIFQGKLENTTELNNKLKQLFLRYEQVNKGNKNPLNTTVGNIYDSESDIFNIPDNAILEIRAKMHSAMSSWVKKVNNFTDEEFRSFKFRYESWFHITRKGGCKTLHNHGTFSWAMVYYVDEGGESPVDYPKSGMIQFYDPRRVSQNAWDVGLRDLDEKSQIGGFGVKPQSGNFIIFPGYLDHEVLTYHGDKERMMIAVNCSVVTSDAPQM